MVSFLVMTMEKFFFRWNRNESGSLFGHRVAIIEDLPKPVKNACDALPSAVLSDNAMAAAEVKNTDVKFR
jgi:hypothetical protein